MGSSPRVPTSEVTRFPAPGNKVLAYAHYKLAYVYWNKGDVAQALGEMKHTIEMGAQFPNLPNAAPLAASARRDIVPLYALRGDPKKAHDFFFRPLSGDSAGQSAHTFQMMDDLGQAYLDVGHYQEGIDLYQDLLKRDRGPKSCAYQAHVTEAVLAQEDRATRPPPRPSWTGSSRSNGSSGRRATATPPRWPAPAPPPRWWRRRR